MIGVDPSILDETEADAEDDLEGDAGPELPVRLREHSDPDRRVRPWTPAHS